MRQILMLCAALSVASSSAAEPIFPEVRPGYSIEFPRDEGAHPLFRTEWWYITGWLETEADQPLGFQITFFRSRTGVAEENPSRFAPSQLLFAHVAIGDPKQGVLIRDERAARAGFGLAEASETGLDVRIDEWSLRRVEDRYVAQIDARDLSMSLTFTPTQPPLLQGERGFSQKGPNPLSASYYYSLPQLATTGRIVIEGREHQVAGRAWFDHEWSSAIMDEEASGWDWIGLNLEDGGALMAFQMRNQKGGEHWAAAKRRSASGEVESYDPAEVDWSTVRVWRSPRTGVTYPVEQRVRFGDRTIRLVPLFDDQENDARGSTGVLYWEGAVRALNEDGEEIGRGFLELTGYGSRLRF